MIAGQISHVEPVTSEEIPALDTSPMNSAGSSLAELAGLDYSIGLQRMSGKVEVYEKLLRQFSTNAEKEMAALRQNLADDQRDKARRLAHSLKGSSGILGATGMYELASALEESLRSQADDGLVAAHLEALALETRRLTDGIANASQ